ncbi:MAG: hypothetical protein MZV70_34110 [Desulfobacterales bacterium]|nr:hypothetical protein [Desulfobacterales bacterium]
MSWFASSLIMIVLLQTRQRGQHGRGLRRLEPDALRQLRASAPCSSKMTTAVAVVFMLTSLCARVLCASSDGKLRHAGSDPGARSKPDGAGTGCASGSGADERKYDVPAIDKVRPNRLINLQQMPKWWNLVDTLS